MQIFGRYQCQYGYLANNGAPLVLEADKGESVLSVVYYLVLTFYLLRVLAYKVQVTVF